MDMIAIQVPKWSEYAAHLAETLEVETPQDREILALPTLLYLPRAVWADLHQAHDGIAMNHATFGQLVSFLLLEGLIKRAESDE